MDPQTGPQRLEEAYDVSWGLIHDELFPAQLESTTDEPRQQILDAFGRLWKLTSDERSFRDASFALMNDFSRNTFQHFDNTASFAHQEVRRKLEELCQQVNLPERYSSPHELAYFLIDFTEAVFLNRYVKPKDSRGEFDEAAAQMGIGTILDGGDPHLVG